MEYTQFLDIIKQAGKLKTTPRHCYTEEGRYESVADHSYRISLMAMLLAHEEEFKDVDMSKVTRMCLIHDFGARFTGDIPAFLKKKEDEEIEDNVFYKWVESFPEDVREEWISLLDEMGKLETKEARIYKALDKIEAIIAHDESDISTWLENEYDLHLTYGQENMQFSEFFQGFRELVDCWTKEKIESNK